LQFNVPPAFFYRIIAIEPLNCLILYPASKPVELISDTSNVEVAERIAARWTDHRKVPQIAFKPDRTKRANAAPFNRNNQMLAVLPIGKLHFPVTGIQDNLAYKAKKLETTVWKFGEGAH
jgi:hypothetical protein